MDAENWDAVPGNHRGIVALRPDAALRRTRFSTFL